ncbi:MAG: hypothetical protein CVV33_02970 [Methanomicrobiales archaeon HGW-Methanomicrobiales-4]|nr:MAG: hypothetical protein CVV33_02970 [Methanomicrobiales archaeon HGW-Methanomicrobiales-4]
MIRNSWAFLLAFLLLISPYAVLAADPEPHGYITIQDVAIDLQQGYADVHVTYNLDDAFRFLMLMFGENDVKTRLLELMGFENVTLIRMDYDSADLKVYDVKEIYGDGLYWFPAHQFGTIIPNLTIRSNQSCQQFSNITELENGTVYF